MPAWMVVGCSRAGEPPERPVEAVIALASGWEVQSSAVVGRDGSRDGEWIPIRAPMTVGAALFEAGRVPDPYVGDGLRRWPGWLDDLRHQPMPADSPFAVPWWYRTPFDVDDPIGHALLHLDGLNERAVVWLNGARIGEVRGTFRRFTLDVSGHLAAANALTLEVSPQGAHDLGFTWLDWNPTPPDRNLGLHDAVWIERTGPLAIVDPWVRTFLAGDGAALTVVAELRNLEDHPVDGALVGTIRAPDGSLAAQIEQRATVPARGTVGVSADLQLDAPSLWWPAGMGEQPLYTLDLQVAVAGVSSDTHSLRFGIREIGSALLDGVRQFRVNGRPVQIRGAGWSSDLLLRRPPGKLEAQLDLVRDLGLNAVRLEGMIEPEAFHRRCDELGILVLAGWSCCDRWEQTAEWTDDDLALATATLDDRIRVLRAHPSTLAFLYGSDHPPVDRVEAAYLEVLGRGWDAATLSAAAEADAPRSEPTGVKMRGPYAPVSPSYWLRDSARGGGFGFATEVGPGASIPSLAGLRPLHGDGPLWPIDDRWLQHAGPRSFDHLGRLEAEIRHRYGPAVDLEDWLRKAHLVVYDGHRAMFEAYRANAGATGVIAWKLNSAWPSLYWSLYDWDLRPGAAYFGAKEANRPVHVLFRYDDRGVVVVNATPDLVDVRVTSRVLGLDGVERSRDEHPVRVPGGDGVVRVTTLTLPARPSLVRLELRDTAGGVLDVNTYWLGARPDVVDFGFRDPRTEWFATPTARYTDLTALARIPPASVQLEAKHGRVTVHNGPTVALLVALTAVDADGKEVLPVRWSDNDLTLLPGESRTVEVGWPGGGEAVTVVHASGFNLADVATPR